MAGSIRVLIADDHTVFADGLTALLATIEGIQMVGLAHDGIEAAAMARRLQPDVVLMDLNMPQRNGIDATRDIVQASPHIKILILSMFENEESLMSAMRAGAHGYLLKGSGREEIERAVHSVAAGSMVFGPTLGARLLRSLEPTAVPPATGRDFPELSQREFQILELIATGVNNTAISERLFLSPKTVRNHITRIFAKLAVADRAQAIVLFQQRRVARD